MSHARHPEPTPADYKRERELRGTQDQVAELLGVHKVTVAKRETGGQVITREAWLALCSLPLKFDFEDEKPKKKK